MGWKRHGWLGVASLWLVACADVPSAPAENWEPIEGDEVSREDAGVGPSEGETEDPDVAMTEQALDNRDVDISNACITACAAHFTVCRAIHGKSYYCEAVYYDCYQGCRL